MFGHIYSRASLESGLSEENLKLKKAVEPRWSGTVAYRALITKDRFDCQLKSTENEGEEKRMWRTTPVNVRYFLFRFWSELCEEIDV